MQLVQKLVSSNTKALMQMDMQHTLLLHQSTVTPKHSHQATRWVRLGMHPLVSSICSTNLKHRKYENKVYISDILRSTGTYDEL